MRFDGLAAVYLLVLSSVELKDVVATLPGSHGSLLARTPQWRIRNQHTHIATPL